MPSPPIIVDDLPLHNPLFIPFLSWPHQAPMPVLPAEFTLVLDTANPVTPISVDLFRKIDQCKDIILTMISSVPIHS